MPRRHRSRGFRRSAIRGDRRRSRPVFRKFVLTSHDALAWDGSNWVSSTITNNIKAYTDLGGGVIGGRTLYMSFNWRNLNNYSDEAARIQDLNNLFRQKKICGVKVSLMPMNNQIHPDTSQPPLAGNTSTRGWNSRFIMVPYHNDRLFIIAQNNSTLDYTQQMSDERGSRSFNLSRPGSVFFRPRLPEDFVQNADGGGVPTGLGNIVNVGSIKAQWLNTGNTNTGSDYVNHTGLVIAFPNNVAMSMILRVVYYVAYRHSG